MDLCASTTSSTDGNPKGRAQRWWWVNSSLPDPDKPLSPISDPPQLVNNETNATVAESHSRRRGGIFRKARDMGLEISEAVSLAADVVLLTFILVWNVRQSERMRGNGAASPYSALFAIPLSPLPVDD